MRVMQEDGWAGLRDEHGVIQEESLMALRVNLLFDTPETQTNVLVSLTRAAPDGGDSLLAAAVRRLSQRLDLPSPSRALLAGCLLRPRIASAVQRRGGLRSGPAGAPAKYPR